MKESPDLKNQSKVSVDEEMVLIKLSIALKVNIFNIRKNFCLEKMASYIGISAAELEIILVKNNFFEELISPDNLGI